VAALPGDVKQASIAVVLGLKQPGWVVERLSTRREKDGLD
jgi:hypothetical protein